MAGLHVRCPSVIVAISLAAFCSVTPLNAQYSVRIIATSGDDALGAQGATFYSFNLEGLSDDGSIVFSSPLMEGGMFGDMGLWAEQGGVLRLLARQGDPVPSRGDLIFSSSFQGNISPAGVITAVPYFEDDRYGIMAEREGTLELLVAEGDPAPDASGGTFHFDTGQSFSPLPANDGRVLLRARNDYHDGVTWDDPYSLWLVDTAAGTLTPLAIGGEAMPGVDAEYDRANVPFSLGPVNSSGQVAYVATGDPPTSGLENIMVLYRWSEAAGHEVLVQAPARITVGNDPNVPGISIEHVTLNAAGQVGVQGFLPPDAVPVQAIYVIDGPGQIRKVVSKGDVAPGAGSATFAGFLGGDSFVLLDNGRIALWAELSDGRHGIWLEDETGLKAIVIEGDPVPGFAEGVTFAQLPNMVANNSGEVSFTGGYAGPGIQQSENDHGVWVGRMNDLGMPELEEVLSAGAELEVAPGVVRTVGGVYTPSSPYGCFRNLSNGGVDGTGEDGLPTYFNDNGEILMEVCFENEPNRMLALAGKSLVVNMASDEGDAAPGDGACDTGGTEVEGRPACTLRAAIMEANAGEGRDKITFDVPGEAPYTIKPKSALPVIQSLVSITGPLGAEGAPAVVLDGSDAVEGASGLTVDFSGRGSDIRNLTVTKFSGHGIALNGTTEVTIVGCYLGTNAAGAEGLGNGSGIHLDDSFFNHIGGVGAGERNVISGNSGDGIVITGERADRNIIEHNTIGTHPNEIAPRANGGHGVLLTGGASENILSDNLISGNTAYGVALVDEGGARTEANDLKGNTIGLDRTGVAFLPNQEGGILIDGARTNGIGALEGEGVRRGNLISGNGGPGITIRGSRAASNFITANVIGLEADGTGPLGNEGSGLFIQNAPRTQVGGIAATLPGTGPGNVISGNELWGIVIEGAEATGTFVEGNLIGTDAAGTAPLRNAAGGILVDGASGTVIGGPGPDVERPAGTLTPEGALNIISGHDGSGRGILLRGTSGTIVVGNYVGLDATGTAALPNADGIVLVGGSENQVGLAVLRSDGYVSYRPNWIAGNTKDGVRLEQGAAHNTVRQNYVGVHNHAGATVLLPNGAAGIRVLDAPSNWISANHVRGHEVDIVVEKGGARHNAVAYNHLNGSAARPTDGIRIDNAPETEIFANHLEGGYQVGIRISGPGARRTSLTDNEVAGAATFTALLVEDAVGTQVGRPPDPRYSFDRGASNRFAGATQGIVLRRSSESRVVNNYVLDNIEVGILIDGAYLEDITGNHILRNGRGIEQRGVNEALVRIEGNDIMDNTGLQSGIHIEGGAAVVSGNHITGDAGNGITVNGGTLTARNNNFTGNAGSGLFLAGGTADARGNWWGDASGPGGSGPGSGDEVSAGVDFSAWRAAPVGLVLFAVGDTAYVRANSADTVYATLSNWAHPTETADVVVSDAAGWIDGDASAAVALSDTVASGIAVPLAVPEGTSGSSLLRFTATSRTDAADIATDSLVVVAYTSTLMRLAVAPDTARLAPGETQAFTASGIDQEGYAVNTAVSWSATGGTITEAGLYTAGSEAGTYAVAASDASGQIQDLAVVEITTEVDAERPGEELPTAFALHQSYPNPFNQWATIPFDVKEPAHVVLKVYDMLGREVATLIQEDYQPGRHKVTLDASRLPSGMYFYEIRMGGFRDVRKMVLLR